MSRLLDAEVYPAEGRLTHCDTYHSEMLCASHLEAFLSKE